MRTVKEFVLPPNILIDNATTYKPDSLRLEQTNLALCGKWLSALQRREEEEGE